MPKIVSGLGKIIVATDFEKLPKCNKLTNLVTLPAGHSDTDGGEGKTNRQGRIGGEEQKR